MRLLGLDFETTGLDPIKDTVIEVGAVIWCTERRCPLLIDNYFVNDGVTKVSSFISSLNGIFQSDIDEFGVPYKEGFYRLNNLVEKVEVVVAHNGERFDKKFFNSWANKVDHTEISSVPWLDTLTDIEYPACCSSRKLTYLAADHGFLNPFAHRAVFDVLTMLIVLDKYPIEETIRLMKEDTVLIEAVVSYAEKDLAREKSFKWDPAKRKWLRSMKFSKWQAEEFPFDTRQIKE